MNRFFALPSLTLLVMFSTGCSSQDTSQNAKKGLPVPASGLMLASNTKHPFAKYIELVGFRLSEKGQNKLNVKFAVVNHSDADIADLGLNVSLRPVTAKPDEPPFCTFSAKVPSVAPQEVTNASGECTTQLRVYELPDWQFIRATFEITAPSL